MKAFIYGIGLQWKMDIRNKNILVHYYLVPLVFYLVMGAVFTSIMPDAYQTLIQAMIVFGVTLGGVLGSPGPLVEIFGSDIKKAYQVGGIPLWTVVVQNFISAMLHLFLMSMIILFTAPVFFGAVRPSNMGSFFLGLILLIVSSLAIGMVFGLFIKSSSKTGIIGQLVFLPSVLLSGIMFPTAMLPGVLQTVSKILPAAWGFLSMCDATLITGNLYPMVAVFAAAVLLCAFKLHMIRKEQAA